MAAPCTSFKIFILFDFAISKIIYNFEPELHADKKRTMAVKIGKNVFR